MDFRLAKGESLSSGGFTEPDHGSDITAMNTVAVKQGGEYVINGLKTFITNGTISSFVLVLCQTDEQAKPTYRGQSVILVERGTPGFSSAEVGEKMGIKMTSTGELSFSEVRLPVSNLVGKESGGFYLEYEVERFYRDAKIMEIYEGTREIQKNTIASGLLGKM